MNTIIHFIDVGQGNMVLIESSSGDKFICDCNVKGDNEDRVLSYLDGVIGVETPITAFICTHRDADHMRGVGKIHDYFPIESIWDSGYPGTTTDSSEYNQYMELRRTVGYQVIERLTREDFGSTRFRYISARDERLDKNANAQGLVIKVEHHNGGEIASSALLTGDCDAATWRNAIMEDYSNAHVSSSILMAGHHGSITFFEDPSDTKNYYLDHIKAIDPAMTIVSVGDNPHGHPDEKAMGFYTDYSKGSNEGNKVYTTKDQGTIRLTLKNDGWSLHVV